MGPPDGAGEVQPRDVGRVPRRRRPPARPPVGSIASLSARLERLAAQVPTLAAAAAPGDQRRRSRTAGTSSVAVPMATADAVQPRAFQSVIVVSSAAPTQASPTGR